MTAEVLVGAIPALPWRLEEEEQRAFFPPQFTLTNLRSHVLTQGKGAFLSLERQLGGSPFRVSDIHTMN